MIISAGQALTWLDGRNSSEFSNFGGGSGRYTFDIEAGMGAEGLDAMVPTHDAGGTLTSLTQGTNSVSYQTNTIKGVQYAVFDADPGSYTATYSDYGGNSGGGKGVTTTSGLINTLFGSGRPTEQQFDGNIGNTDMGMASNSGGNRTAKNNKQGASTSIWTELAGFGAAVVIAAAILIFGVGYSGAGTMPEYTVIDLQYL